VLKCQIESYITKAMRMGDWAFGDPATAEAEYNFMLRAIEALVHLNVRLIPTVYTVKCYPLTWHTRSWHLMGAQGHLPRLLIEMHCIGCFSARGTEQMQYIFRKLGLSTVRGGKINTASNPCRHKLLKYIREHAWRWSITAMKTAAHQARLAGDKNRAKLKADVGLVARGAVEEVLNKLAAAARPGGQCTAPAEILSAGASTSSSSTQFDNPGAEQLQAHRRWRDELETCRLELQGKGRAPPSGKYVLPASLKKVHLKMDAIKKLYSDMVTRTNFAAPKPKMLRIDMEDALCRNTLSPESDVPAAPVDPDVGGPATAGSSPGTGDGDPADWIFCTPEAWFTSRENWWIAENDAQPSEEACARAQKTLSWSEGGDEDSEIREMGDDQQLRVTSAAISSGDAEAQHEMGQPRSLNAAGIEEQIAGEEVQDIDQADMFTGGADSEILQDEEEVAAMHCETTEGEEEATGGEDEL
jgi:hypothetical protein